METAGEERVRAGRSLRALEDAAAALAEMAGADRPAAPDPAFPRDIAAALAAVTAVSSREDAERLLACGVSMWNAVIVLEGGGGGGEEGGAAAAAREALVRTRHVSVDCIFMATTVLGGISAKFNIDEISLLKFYTSCGKRYAADVGDMEMAAVCFAKAEEFAESARAVASASEGGMRALSKAMFDLLVGSAECAWDRGDSEGAEALVAQAGQYLAELPGEREYLSSILFNLGLFCYQAKEPEKALAWLRASLDTRAKSRDPSMDAAKQAKTARLAGVCHLALKQFDDAFQLMQLAEETCHDPVGAYLLLKLSVLTRADDVMDRLSRTLDDPDATLDVCMASIALLTDAQRVGDAVSGLEKLSARFADDAGAMVRVIGPRYFDALASLGRAVPALQLLDRVCAAVGALQDAEDTLVGESPRGAPVAAVESNKWAARLLSAATALAERKEFMAAALMLRRCLDVSDKARGRHAQGPDASPTLAGADGPTAGPGGNVVLENEASVCRLAASCALCAASDLGLARGRAEDVVRAVSLSAPGEEHEQTVSSLLDQAMGHAQRAKEMDRGDFAARLLVFRTHLLRGEPARAAVEMREASEEVDAFDAGALAEAACEAKDAGSVDSVLAVLRCILRGSASADAGLQTRPPMPGFIGTVLVSAVNIVVEQTAGGKPAEAGAQDGERSVESMAGFGCSLEEAVELTSVLRDGYSCISRVGLDAAFDDKIRAEPALGYLADVAWNAGRRAGLERWFGAWEQASDVCHDFSRLRQQTVAVLQTRRISRLMSATALLERDGESSVKSAVCERASAKLADARSLTADIHSASGGGESAASDPIVPLLTVLEARCCAGRCDHLGLAQTVAAAIGAGEPQAATLEQLASIAFDMTPAPAATGEDRLLRLDTVASALGAALDARLLAAKPDIRACSIVLRELLGVELSRVTGSNRAYLVLQRALGLMAEHQAEYPADEQRWMTATAWDTAQMYCKTAQTAESRRWAEAAITCTNGNAGTPRTTGGAFRPGRAPVCAPPFRAVRG